MAEGNKNRLYIIIGAIVVVMLLFFVFMGGEDPALDTVPAEEVELVPAN